MKKSIHTERLYYVDWLRVIGVLIVFFFHTSMIFVSWNWHINNSESSFIMDTIVRFIHLWIMPLFYVLAGASAAYSLRKRKTREFIEERFKRLILPILGGMLFLIPPQIYLERLSTGEFDGSYIQFLPQFFEGLYPNGNFTLNHLWFVLYLFVVSMISVPLLTRLRSINNTEGTSDATPWILLFPSIAIIMVEATFRSIWPLYLYPTDIMIFLIYFVCGYSIALDQSISRTIKKYSNTALLIGGVLFSFIAALYYRSVIPPPGHSWSFVAFQICWNMTGLIWVTGIIGIGMKRLNRPNSILSIANEAVLPFYIIHQTVILVIAYYAVQWEMIMVIKLLFILASAFIVTVSLYFVLKQFNVTRIMFGLKANADQSLEMERAPQGTFFARFILWLSN